LFPVIIPEVFRHPPASSYLVFNVERTGQPIFRIGLEVGGQSTDGMEEFGRQNTAFRVDPDKAVDRLTFSHVFIEWESE
jgi:hypothetical protein